MEGMKRMVLLVGLALSIAACVRVGGLDDRCRDDGTCDNGLVCKQSLGGGHRCMLPEDDPLTLRGLVDKVRGRGTAAPATRPDAKPYEVPGR